MAATAAAAWTAEEQWNMKDEHVALALRCVVRRPRTKVAWGLWVFNLAFWCLVWNLIIPWDMH